MACEKDQPLEEEVSVKVGSKSKKEKQQGGSFLQRSRNAIIGAADAVRRVATKGTSAFAAEDAKKTEAILLAYDGTIWTEAILFIYLFIFYNYYFASSLIQYQFSATTYIM